MEELKEDRIYQLSISKVLNKFKSNPEQGLSEKEVNSRRQQYGTNEIPDQSSTSIFGLLLDQFKDFMVLVLIGAVVISGFLGQMDDVIAIMAIIILNAVMGFVQEYRAERSLQALKELTAPKALVLRNGQQQEVATAELVPGDIVYLKSGDKIPADGRLIASTSLEVDEAALTGESISVAKEVKPITEEDLSLGDRKNMLYMGTTVVKGKAKLVVTATGLETEMGQIANMLQESEERATPLQKKLDHLGKWLVYLCLVACAAIVALGVAQGESVYNMFLAGVSLAVAAIPEGLPAIVTLSLAIGVQRMIKRQAIVRKLPAVETLGCATTICSDKTGTLTMNQMEVKKIYVAGQSYDLNSNLNSLAILKEPLKIAAICNNAQIKHKCREVESLESELGGQKESMEILGDPTEGALLLAAQKVGLKPARLRSELSKRWEVPFDSERKRMSVIGAKDGEATLYLKGAPDIVLERCSYYWSEGERKSLNKRKLNRLKAKNEQLSSQALRVLAVAKRSLPSNFDHRSLEDYEEELVFVGLIGMIDPPNITEMQKATPLITRKRAQSLLFLRHRLSY
ncbi:cation-translocating P-type ATPase [Fuchsiella alkaliacetigena]|uniref:cation-translocating P-type ATPase n=1 Tax=Fuchsiella alkaliacetigena TaxID=957042 RepID=UPI00200A23FA|nr:HAD-IC family P-type ATPase [Fuchsiella alkaliacetigena]MCK8825943.1 HAD-IC family P-type ATPase [Fuchsiella alkaliacetigena]